MKPQEISKAINEDLMAKPNKGVIFKSFLTSIKDRNDFLRHCLKNVDGVNIEFFNSIIVICNERIKSVIDAEIEKEEAAIKFSQQRLAELKKKKGV